MSESSRLFRDGFAGPIYDVTLAPRELPGGRVDPRVNAIVFEDILVPRVLTAPIAATVLLEDLSDEDLQELLEQASR